MSITFHPDGRVTGGTIRSSGNIIQVQSGFVNTKQNMSSTTFADITGLTVTLSNVHSGSKVYIVSNLHMATADAGLAFRLFRGSTEISQPDVSGIDGAMVCNIDNYNLQVPAAHTFLDTTPGTGTVTYKWQWRSSSGSQTIYLNSYVGGGTNWNSTSSITAMEVAG
tara:strand:+ start:53 stop:550 length:498 start_codon:yes stop_codon:yes gene_type:complete